MKLFCSILFIICNFASFSYFNHNLAPHPFFLDKQQSAHNFKSKYLSKISLGNNNLIASILWITTMIESDIEHYKNKDNNSWMYHRFNTITDLNPYFYHAYKVGGLYLSVIKDDDLGAKDIFGKGIKIYPDDIDLNYYFGFHAQFELNDPTLAVTHYEKVLQNPKGMERFKFLLPSIVAKLKSGLGDKEGALKLLLQMKEKFKDNKPMHDRFNSKITALLGQKEFKKEK